MFRHIVAVLVFLTSSHGMQYSNNSGAPVVNLQYGRFQGGINNSLGINYYYGLRYAAPPTGSLRWRPPVDIDGAGYYPTQEITNVSTHGSSCFQGHGAWDVVNITLDGQSEDCLLLDIVVPSKPKSGHLPVIVLIHGGGYTAGNSQSDPGEAITSYSSGAVVWVDIQYRLGAFGFLSSPDIRDDGVANVGLLDQRAALGWVQRHISRFGGDPAKVTIWGGSAGGGSVMDQMILYGGQATPPFRAAIAEYPWWQNYHNNSILEAQYSEILMFTGCDSLTCLRGVSDVTLATANLMSFVTGYDNGLYGYGDWYYGPSVDGQIIQDLPSNEFKQGHFTNVPLLVNHDAFEGFAFTNKSITEPSEVTPDLQALFPFAKVTFFARLYNLYPLSSFDAAYFSDPLVQYLTSIYPETASNSPFWQLQQIFGDYIIVCPTTYMATALTDAAQPVWKLLFNTGSELHAATSPFLFQNNGATSNATISEIMKDWFLSFAIELDPNVVSFSGLAKPYWPQYASLISMDAAQVSEFVVMEVGATSLGVVGDADVGERCDFWQAQSYVVRN